jgi:hypothetical protein
MWKIFNKLFGWQYVILHVLGDRPICRAYKLGKAIYAHPYCEETRCELLPKGVTKGQSYITGWSPITDKTINLYEVDDETN